MNLERRDLGTQVAIPEFVKNSNNTIIAVVGGGACGTSQIYHLTQSLIQNNLAQTTHIYWFEPRTTFGPGLAYQNDSDSLLINRTTETMSAVEGDPEHFYRWTLKKGLTGEFLPRRVFGEYLIELARESIERFSKAGGTVTQVSDEVLSITHTEKKDRYNIQAKSLAEIKNINYIILALGNLPSKRFKRFANHPNFISSAYPTHAWINRIPKTEPVIILGSRLSAIDASLALMDQGHLGMIHLVSKRGELPSVRGRYEPFQLQHFESKPSRTYSLSDIGDMLLSELGMKTGNFGELLSLLGNKKNPIEYLSKEIISVKKGARKWQSLGIALNSVIEELWNQLSTKDQKQFFDQFYSTWIAYRVPIPQSSAEKLLRALVFKKLEVHSGFQSIEPFCDGFEITLRQNERIYSEYVIDATGNPRFLHELHSPLLDSMLRSGMIQEHPQGGIYVDFHTSKITDSMFAVGNLTQGVFLFTSVLELNVKKIKSITDQIINQMNNQLKEIPNEKRSDLSAQESSKLYRDRSMEVHSTI